ncbi:LamG domain-containing protein [Thioalkalivibrio sp. XN8]|uniref:LamG domain-containing protein n=1 Tax=Thioalkalivibrio sp. XN8 TaxID=2712863 RepID=UPI0013EB93D7|nr:LamG domain-containing protein [Thioalkalivibrio sp. XN8]NGP54446.1 LamG domain-containing protein [Thioalkalivibrio sp. XN8]
MQKKEYSSYVVMLGFLAFVHAGTAIAQSCEAYFPFDGSLADASGNGFDGRMLGQDGAAATPRFVEGRSGQALAFDGTSAMRVLMDLHYEGCPQVSFTAWIRVDGPVQKGNQAVLATGGSGPGLRMGGPNLILNGTANGLAARGVVSGDSGWMFVAGVYDYDNNTYSLHWRNRSIEGTLSEHRRPPEDALWVGAMNDRLTDAASILLDDLRLIGRALGVEELAALRSGGSSGTAVAAASAGGSSDWQGASCSQHVQCGAGSYCGLDGRCHPAQHAPMQQAPRGSGITATTNPIEPGATIGLPSGAPLSGTGSTPEEGSAGSTVGVSVLPESLGDADLASGPSGAPDLTYESEEAAEVADADAGGTADGTGQAQAAEPRPTGSPRFSAIAGTPGDVQRIVDLETAFLRRIWWREHSDVPCRIGVSEAGSQATLDGATGAQTPIEICPAAVFSAGNFRVALDSSVISSIEVCQRDSNQRLKGIRVVGDRVNTDGTVEYVPGATDQESVTNCQTWSPRVLCPSQQVATGLVVHTQERRGDTEAITGLQLVCRAVTVQAN